MPCSLEEYVPVLTVRLSGNVVSIYRPCQQSVYAASYFMWDGKLPLAWKQQLHHQFVSVAATSMHDESVSAQTPQE